MAAAGMSRIYAVGVGEEFDLTAENLRPFYPLRVVPVAKREREHPISNAQCWMFNIGYWIFIALIPQPLLQFLKPILHHDQRRLDLCRGRHAPCHDEAAVGTNVPRRVKLRLNL